MPLVKFRNNSFLPVVLSYLSDDGKRIERVVNHGVAFDFHSNDQIIVHNDLYDNMYKYEWLKRNYHIGDVANFSLDGSQIYISDFDIKIDGNIVRFSEV
jgi:hypothetical protein